MNDRTPDSNPYRDVVIEPEQYAQLDAAHEQFERSIDGTLGIEEEYAICDPETLDMVPEFEALRAAALSEGLDQEIAGELLASEIEVRTGRCEHWVDAVSELTDIRKRLSNTSRDQGYLLGGSATHPWADYREQSTVPLPYYEKLVDRMQFVARRNNTFGLHIHVGVQGADRAIKIHDALRNISPLFLALSASSPFLDATDTGFASARSITFSRGFPRANVAPIFGTLDGYLEHLRWLFDSGSITTTGQVWWGTRPHIAHGTIELRMFDGQPDVRDTLALAALSQGVILHLSDLHDAGELPAPVASYQIDENTWRAARSGTDALLMDLPSTNVVPASELLMGLVADARGANQRHSLGIDGGLDRIESMIAAGSSALWQRDMFVESGELSTAYRAVVDATMSSAHEPALA